MHAGVLTVFLMKLLLFLAALTIVGVLPAVSASVPVPASSSSPDILTYRCAIEDTFITGMIGCSHLQVIGNLTSRTGTGGCYTSSSFSPSDLVFSTDGSNCEYWTHNPKEQYYHCTVTVATCTSKCNPIVKTLAAAVKTDMWLQMYGTIPAGGANANFEQYELPLAVSLKCASS